MTERTAVLYDHYQKDFLDYIDQKCDQQNRLYAIKNLLIEHPVSKLKPQKSRRGRKSSSYNPTELDEFFHLCKEANQSRDYAAFMLIFETGASDDQIIAIKKDAIVRRNGKLFCRYVGRMGKTKMRC